MEERADLITQLRNSGNPAIAELLKPLSVDQRAEMFSNILRNAFKEHHDAGAAETFSWQMENITDAHLNEAAKATSDQLPEARASENTKAYARALQARVAAASATYNRLITFLAVESKKSSHGFPVTMDKTKKQLLSEVVNCWKQQTDAAADSSFTWLVDVVLDNLKKTDETFKMLLDVVREATDTRCPVENLIQAYLYLAENEEEFTPVRYELSRVIAIAIARNTKPHEHVQNLGLSQAVRGLSDEGRELVRRLAVEVSRREAKLTSLIHFLLNKHQTASATLGYLPNETPIIRIRILKPDNYCAHDGEVLAEMIHRAACDCSAMCRLDELFQIDVSIVDSSGKVCYSNSVRVNDPADKSN